MVLRLHPSTAMPMPTNLSYYSTGTETDVTDRRGGSVPFEASWSSLGLENIGSIEWLTKVHVPLLNLRKLVQQAVVADRDPWIQAWVGAADSDSSPHLMMLVRELIVSEVIHMHVRAQSFGPDIEIRDGSSIQTRCLLDHERTVLSILETVLFISPVCKSLGTASVDIMDYVYRKVCRVGVSHEERFHRFCDICWHGLVVMTTA